LNDCWIGQNGRGARFKKHVVEFNEGSGPQTRLVPARENQIINGEVEDDIADVWTGKMYWHQEQSLETLYFFGFYKHKIL